MARTVAVIQAEIIAFKSAQPELAGLNSPSTRAIWRLWTFVVASSIAIFEQLQDLYLASMEALVARSPGASALWVQDKFFKFQYDANTPQVIQLVNTIPIYPIVDENKRIVTACSVTSPSSNNVLVKVAKENPYTALSANELLAAQSMIDTIGVSGIVYTVSSIPADFIYVGATVYYKGQYSSVIYNLVSTAITDYFQTLSQINFNGALKMSDLEGIIRGVEGVSDVVMNNVYGRPYNVSFGGGTILISGNTNVAPIYTPLAGYMVVEPAGANDLSNSLNFLSV